MIGGKYLLRKLNRKSLRQAESKSYENKRMGLAKSKVRKNKIKTVDIDIPVIKLIADPEKPIVNKSKLEISKIDKPQQKKRKVKNLQKNKFKKLTKINGIGKKTIIDISKFCSNEEELIQKLKNNQTPLYDNIEQKLKDYYKIK